MNGWHATIKTIWGERMADRRMLTKKVTDADEFISLPSSAQALYLHLNMGADDDGFNNQVQLAMYKAHASVDDVKVLLAKRYIIQFESGVIVIKHWRLSNAIRKDRYTPTSYQEEFQKLGLKDNGSYTVANWLPNGCQTVAAGKDSKGKDSTGEENKAPVEPLPLNDGTEWLPTREQFDEWVRLYPSVDVAAEFRNMRGWCMANPTRRKTARGINTFVNGWLSRTQNKPRITQLARTSQSVPDYMYQEEKPKEKVKRW